MARAVISIPIVTESAAIKLPTKKTPFAIKRIGLRPKMSENLPHMGVEAAEPSRYADPIHVYPAADPKYSEIVGKAVVMIVI